MTKRKERRHGLALGALFRTQGNRCDVLIADLSRHGCRITAAGLRLAVGQRIVIKPRGLEGLTGTIRWWTGQYGGVQFDFPLHPAVVDHLCRLHPDDAVTIEFHRAA